MHKILLVFISVLIIIVLVLTGVFFYKTYIKKYSISLPTAQVIQKSLSLKQAASLQSAIPNYDHIVILIMENKTTGDIIGNQSAPFINVLAKQNSLAANYSAVSNPSLPNYLSLIGGSTFGITSDCTNCFVSSNSLIDQLEQNHKSWKAYMESMPSSCFVGDAYPYAQKHNPFIYFNNIRNNPDRCKKIVSLDELSKDLTTPISAPNFIWITPNMCNDMHDCSISQGDTWLSQEVPQILNSSIFKLQKSLLIITWDEGESSSNKVTTILIGSGVKQGFSSNAAYTHYSLLKTIDTAWNLSALTANDSNAESMNDFFK